VSRSFEKRVALQKGEPMPRFVELTPEQVCTALVPLLEHKALTTVIPWGEITEKLNAILATAQPEQAKVLDFEKPGQISVNAPTCAKCGKIFLDCKCSQPRAASGGALSENVTGNLSYALSNSPSSEWAGLIEQHLAAHDQKVREPLREAVDSCDLPRAWRAKSPCQGPEEICCHRRCADELTDWIRRILRAEEVSGATSAAKDGDAT